MPFSGGKDSLVVLDLCVSRFPRVVPVYFYMFPDLEIDDRILAITERRYGLKTMRYPAKSLTERLRQGALRTTAVQGVPRITNQDLEELVRHDTGIDWFASGERINDSMARRARLKRCRGMEEPQRRIFPIYTWSTAEVYAYLTTRRIPKPIRFGHAGTAGVSGLAMNHHSLAFLRDEYPTDYERIRKVFPHVESVIAREEFKQRRAASQAVKSPEIRADADQQE